MYVHLAAAEELIFVQRTRRMSRSPDLLHRLAPQIASIARCQKLNGGGVEASPNPQGTRHLQLSIRTPHIHKKQCLPDAKEAVTPRVPRPPMEETGLAYFGEPMGLVLVPLTLPTSLGASAPAAE